MRPLFPIPIWWNVLNQHLEQAAMAALGVAGAALLLAGAGQVAVAWARKR